MMQLSARVVLLGALIAAVAAPSASAEPSPTVDKQKAKTAKQYVEAGLAAQSSGDYDTAITLYQKAYDLVPHPVLLFNMAQAHRLAGRDDQAIELYNKYLSLDPNAPQAGTARDLRDDLVAKKAKVAADKAAAEKAAAEKAAADNAAAEKAAIDRKSAELARTQHAADPQHGTSAHAPDSSLTESAVSSPPSDESGTSLSSPGRTLRLAGIGVGAVGVIGLGAGIAFGLHARSLSNDLSKPGAVYDPSKVSSGESANRNAIIGLVTGGVCIVAGGTLYWRGHVAGSRVENVAVAPLVTDQVTGLVLSGSL